MRTSVICILMALALVVVLLYPDPVQGWRRRRRRRRWIRIRGRKLIRTVSTAIKVYQAVGGRKRGAELAGPLAEGDLGEVASDVTASCPEAKDSTVALLTEKFGQMDADNDKSLTGEELDNFIAFLATNNPCQK